MHVRLWVALLGHLWSALLLGAQTLVATRGSNIREDPSTDHDPIGHVIAGDTLHKLEPQNIGGYGLVRFGEIEGWIWLRNTRVVEESTVAANDLIAESGLSKPCPVDGNGKSEKQRATDRLKNRTAIPSPTDFDPTVSLTKLLRKGSDESCSSETQAGEIIGYVEKVKPGGVETNNCHSEFPEDHDTHIELSAKPGGPSSRRVIIEVTPRMPPIVAAQDFTGQMTLLCGLDA